MEKQSADMRLQARLREVARLFDLTGAIGSAGSVYRISGATPAILKPLQIGAAQSLAITRLLMGAAERGWDFLPALIGPHRGIHADAGFLWQRGNRYLATRQLPGRSADYYTDQDVAAAIRLMAVWHGATGAALSTDGLLRKLLVFDPAASWEIRCREMDACRKMAWRHGDTFSRDFLAVWRDFRDQAARACQEIKATRTGVAAETSTPPVVCYHDWAFHNVLIDGPKAYLIDFDYMIADQPAHDRANLVHRYLRLFQWSPQAFAKILRLFDRHYRCRPGELRLLRIYLTFPYDYWMIGRQFFIERQPWSAAHFRDQWQRKIAARQARQRALNLLERLE